MRQRTATQSTHEESPECETLHYNAPFAAKQYPSQAWIPAPAGPCAPDQSGLRCIKTSNGLGRCGTSSSAAASA